MKLLSLLTVVFMSFSTISYAQSDEQNKEFSALSVEAARTIHNLNWNEGWNHVFLVVEHRYNVNENSAEGTYLVRLFYDNGSDLIDGGKDFEVYVFNGSIGSIKILCRTCN